MLSHKELEEWDARILELVNEYGLNCYPQEFEICDHYEMLGYMSYSGMPSRYPHWSFGKSFEREKTMYDYGVGGLPYEMVINSNPCLAYLMRDNTDLLQILTIAHVYGHNDFFANNFTFTSAFDAKYTLEMFKTHADRVRSYIEDPSIGIEKVERILDAAHALSLQRSKNLAIKKLSRGEKQQRLWESAQPQEDEFSELHIPVQYKEPNLGKIPLEPEQNLLEFIAMYNPYLSEWERDLLLIVDKEAAYFIPQIETKIMNEGWASYWHFKILNELHLSSSLHMEFLVRHNQVLRPTPGGLNPYHLGFILWQDIERRWNEGDTGEEYSDKARVDTSSLSENETPGRKKIFQIRESDRDISFLRRFLTRELMQELNLFQHEKRGKDRVITKVSDEESWESVKETLIRSIGMGTRPVIMITDADYGKNRTLYLKHEHEGRDLQLEYCEKTLSHLTNLWGRAVILETIVNGKPSKLKIVDNSLKVERI
ncbi:MAG TPA: SpoVR family protein [Oligoflexia bacterium]|nr:SpoVR family protein [Oligoflexia bacterium]HMP47914.1 SpoVR family protein [Oligoflexia bacterium]